ncbi:hypothetical protein CC77DRAFT_639652 [Alternaria alternata]|jgi:hypothetical protein|uniref:Uncharacterized protein n=1 Tax=Alternaria alternata TaxID=5599 RepID=A0A177DW84_ALTAL|nr:hypothetical protein CC77DRAFT_639652 [Alternaria alternata]OAG23943.1 hypothetical protein CC77DRAFT_639652 [Alternaria alternata]RII06686.1 hypothetical protein CUC08_Gglean009915 [Alternaria sp. MG1]
MGDVSHLLKDHFPPLAYYFYNLKQRVLFDAYAYNVKFSSKAEHFDLITSTTSTGRLDGVECLGALVVYYDPKLHDLKMLYKSKSCPTAEDVVFEAKYRLKVMSTIVDKMDEGNTWAPEEASEQKPLTGALTKKEKGDDAQATKDDFSRQTELLVIVTVLEKPTRTGARSFRSSQPPSLTGPKLKLLLSCLIRSASRPPRMM